jgi:hypothetical protein
VPGLPFFVGLLVIGTLCVACELRAIAATRHQRPQHDTEDRDGQDSGGPTVVWLALLELVLDVVAAVGMVIGVVLVLVAVVGLGAHVIAG